MPRSSLWFAYALFLGACAGSRGERAEEPQAPIASPTSAMLPPGQLHRTSRAVDFDEMVRDLAQADIVYVGEVHDDPEHHRLQLRILEQLYARGRLHAIAMEMFQRPFQDALDAYTVRAEIGEEELLERTGWTERWGYDFALYRDILRFARDKRLPVIALNVRKEIVSAVSGGGLDALDDETRRSLPALDPGTDPAGYREFLRGWYEAHVPEGDPVDEQRFERFFTVMRLWDEGMAQTLVGWFRERAPDDAQVLVLAGGGHVAHRFGLPDRVERRIGKTARVVVPIAAGEAEGDPTVFAHGYADYVWLVPGDGGAGPSLAGTR